MRLVQNKKQTIIFLGGVLLFILLVIVFTYPLVFHLTDSIPGKNDYTDGPMFLWNLWWAKESILHLINPFYTTMIFAPQSANLSLHTLTLSLGLLFLPLTLILKNFLLVGNIMVFFSFGLTGFFTYKLTKLLFNSTVAAFFSACYLSLHPYIISHLYAGHFNLIQIWTIPAFFWIWFIKFNNWQKKSLWLGIVLVFQSYIDFHYTFFILLSIPILLCFDILHKIDLKQNIKIISLTILVWFILLLPIIGGIHKTPPDTESSVSRTIQTNYWYLFTYNNPFNPWLGKESWTIIEKLPGSVRENTLTLGWTMLFLAMGGILFIGFNKKYKHIWVFVAIGLVFFIISPGETLWLWGKQWPMPYRFLKDFPGFNQGLVLSRFGIMVIFSVSILATLCLSILAKNKKIPTKIKFFITSILFILMLVEIFSFPLTLDRVVYNPQKLKASLDFSSGWNFQYIPHSPRSSYYVTLFNRPVIGGYLGRRINNLYQPYYNDSAGIRLLNNPSSNISEEDYNMATVYNNFHNLKLKYIMVDKEIISNKAQKNILSYLEYLTLPLIYSDKQLDVYEVK